MGLIAKLKNMFNKNIDCSNELGDSLVHFYTTSGRTVKLNTSIVVKEGYVVVIVCKDRVTDVLPEGKHKIDNASIPNTFRLLKLYKIDQDGKSPNSFKCDFYFVSKRFVRDFVFVSDVPYYKRKDPLGKVEAYSEGAVTLNIDDPAKLITYLLIDNAYIKDKTAVKEISLEIGNFINKRMEKIDLNFQELLTQSKYVHTFLNKDVITPLEYMGINISNIVVSGINMSTKLQKKLELVPQTPKKLVTPAKQMVEVTSNGASGFEMNLNEGFELGDQGTQQPTFFEESTPLGNEKTCLHCGQTIKYTARFCEHCGNKQ